MWLALVALATAQFLMVLDQSVMNVFGSSSKASVVLPLRHVLDGFPPSRPDSCWNVGKYRTGRRPSGVESRDKTAPPDATNLSPPATWFLGLYV